MDEGVELLTDPGQTVCLVSAPRAEEEIEEEVEEGEEGVEGAEDGEGAEGEAPGDGAPEAEGDSDG
jgi:hypothetical protein